jgi:protein gp37
MADRSKIEWTEATWNPVTGCVEVSEGCDHCYARTFAERWRGVTGHPYEQGFDLRIHPDRLDQPLRWKRPRVVFVNSMSDLFQDGVPDVFIAQVYRVMHESPRHTFQILTKRPGRMASTLGRWTEAVWPLAEICDPPVPGMKWPLPNVWLGTSVETQKWANVRIPKLLDTPAAVRFVSVEPMLGPVDLSEWVSPARARRDAGVESSAGLDWVIVGGESGPGARPMRPDWARTIRDQCVAAGVAFFFKQWGGRTPKAGGRELDGRTWDEMPTRDPAGARTRADATAPLAGTPL